MPVMIFDMTSTKTVLQYFIIHNWLKSIKLLIRSFHNIELGAPTRSSIKRWNFSARTTSKQHLHFTKPFSQNLTHSSTTNVVRKVFWYPRQRMNSASNSVVNYKRGTAMMTIFLDGHMWIIGQNRTYTILCRSHFTAAIGSTTVYLTLQFPFLKQLNEKI